MLVVNLKEFDDVLNELFEKKYGGIEKLPSLQIVYSKKERKDEFYSELKDEFCGRYHFKENLFDIALEGWYAKTNLETILDILKDSIVPVGGGYFIVGTIPRKEVYQLFDKRDSAQQTISLAEKALQNPEFRRI